MSFDLCYVLIPRFILLFFVLYLFSCFVFFAFYFVWLFILLHVLFIFMYIVVFFLFVNKFTDHCHQVKTQLKLTNFISYIQ